MVSTKNAVPAIPTTVATTACSSTENSSLLTRTLIQLKKATSWHKPGWMVRCRVSTTFHTKNAKRGHVLAGLDGAEADERDLHGQNGAQDVHGGVGNVDAVVEAARHNEHKYVQRDEVDEEDVAAPRRHLRHIYRAQIANKD